MEIKTCPFCGQKAELIEREFGDSPHFSVQCVGEDMHQLDFWSENPDDSINYWNKRI